ncbi:hypothetical protein GLOIN_2v1880978 [Rhizophagus irregularis DAOM 181602=DAOM 197198]|uniref:Uncharacterized protein n=2 Tax=Rhizophagus irregularis TaxID=588596 RepID=U9TL59_RHIID|nr:hypothetical protein GLOIN_2v1880978 [Rhizophagus irregularis DAOM 181602=DAOM 197198]POG64893.1 hypothetical protein GLOIN_2v1880978 [Rhizophagus irregularis DAOM 181602=DAOM 197198]|eukprot:XP_025171759.1 hypothetical protein GLOIN_2v1880978 [Rhizophagus irregularis DAOM 181602=DAOM 197198]
MITTSDLEENAENAKYKYITKQITVKTISFNNLWVNLTTCSYLCDVIVDKKNRTCYGLKICEFASPELSTTEQNAIMREYTTLNDKFEQRLKDENRYQDKREVGDKRLIFDSPKKSKSSESESEEEAEEIKPYVIKSEKEESSTKAKKKMTQKKKKKRNYRK